MKLNILYEDNHLIIAEKPPGVPSQADSSGDTDMLGIVKAYIKDKYAKPGDAWLGLVHRLDRPAGGVMVFARTSKAASRLSDQIRTRKFGKMYLAVVEGVPKASADRLIHHLLKDPGTNSVSVTTAAIPGAMEAVLDYSVLESENAAGSSLVQIRLHTGRPHQIRAQFAAIGHPLLGDRKYGGHGYNEHDGKHDGKGRGRTSLALWSMELRFSHPVNGTEMVFRSFPPDEYPWILFKDIRNAEGKWTICSS